MDIQVKKNKMTLSLLCTLEIVQINTTQVVNDYWNYFNNCSFSAIHTNPFLTYGFIDCCNF